MDTSQIKDHLEVVGSDGAHVGIVDHLEGEDRFKLTHRDSNADGKHHFLPIHFQFHERKARSLRRRKGRSATKKKT